MVFEKTLGEIVDENYVYARALHYLGIDFFESPGKKLKEICEEKGLNRQQVIKSFYRFDSCSRLSFAELQQYPLELLTEYLKHAHHIFIKDKLPYIIHLVKKWEDHEHLKNLLPEFVEDFIKHIYEEEDTTFKYIESICALKKGTVKAPFSRMLPFIDFSLKAEFESHQHEDEFGGIRQLMSAFEPKTLHERVLQFEINAFDREMIYHAEIENNIFFPKAIALEKDVRQKLRTLTQLN